jgi:perosamine synthetase
LGTAQLRKLETILANKRRLADRYATALAGVPFSLQREPAATRSSWWLVAGTVDSAATREGLTAHLASRSIETRPVFRPVQRYPMYAACGALTPQSDRIGDCGLCLPSGPWMADEQIDRVAFEIHRYFNQ